MFKLLTLIVFIWLLCKTIVFTFKLTWGAAKIVSGILMVLALPLMIVGILFVGGVVLLVPVVLVCIAAGITKICINT